VKTVTLQEAIQAHPQAALAAALAGRTFWVPEMGPLGRVRDLDETKRQIELPAGIHQTLFEAMGGARRAPEGNAHDALHQALTGRPWR
jgi:hypothetical protein